MRRLRHLQSLGIYHPGGGPMLHKQWKEQTLAARAATNHHRTEGVLTKRSFLEGRAMSAIQAVVEIKSSRRAQSNKIIGPFYSGC